MNIKRILIWAAAIVNIPRYAGAFIYADLAVTPPWLSNVLNIANMVSGVMMGIIEAIAIALIMDGLRSSSMWSKSGLFGINWRWVVNLLFGMGMMVIAIFILVPFMNARMNDQQMREILPTPTLQAGWNLFVVLAPIFIIAGASFSQTDFVNSKKGEGKGKGSETSGEDAENFPKDWRKMTKDQKRKLAAILRKKGIIEGKKQIQTDYNVHEKTADNWTNNLKKEGFLS